MLTVQLWENARGLPAGIASAVVGSKVNYFNNLDLLIAIAEYKTSLKGSRRPSQSDVFALLRSSSGLAAVTVEGKAREDFGQTMDQRRDTVSNFVAGPPLDDRFPDTRQNKRQA